MTIARYSLVNKFPYTYYRSTPDTYVNGRLVEGTETAFTLYGNWWPLKGYDKQMLPEAFRSRYTLKLSTVTELFSLVEGTAQQPPDEVEIDGFRFEVAEKDKYSMRVRDHFEYLLVRKEISAGGS